MAKAWTLVVLGLAIYVGVEMWRDHARVGDLREEVSGLLANLHPRYLSVARRRIVAAARTRGLRVQENEIRFGRRPSKHTSARAQWVKRAGGRMASDKVWVKFKVRSWLIGFERTRELTVSKLVGVERPAGSSPDKLRGAGKPLPVFVD